MQLKPKNLTIPPGNPFGEDKLSRLQSANVLTQLVSTIREPFVLAIDSPWGTGKTTFIKMWMASLKEKNGFPAYALTHGTATLLEIRWFHLLEK